MNYCNLVLICKILLLHLQYDKELYGNGFIILVSE